MLRLCLRVRPDILAGDNSRQHILVTEQAIGGSNSLPCRLPRQWYVDVHWSTRLAPKSIDTLRYRSIAERDLAFSPCQGDASDPNCSIRAYRSAFILFLKPFSLLSIAIRLVDNGYKLAILSLFRIHS